MIVCYSILNGLRQTNNSKIREDRVEEGLRARTPEPDGQMLFPDSEISSSLFQIDKADGIEDWPPEPSRELPPPLHPLLTTS